MNKFEKQNPTISVNVLGYDDENKIIYPLRISKMDKREHEVNLLLLEDKHYILINNMSRLLTCQKSKHTQKRHFFFTLRAGLIQAVRKKQLFRTWLCG